MKLVNNIIIRTFAPPEDNQREIKETFLNLIGYNEEELKKEKIKYEEKTAKGFNERKIKTFTCILEKDKHCNKLLDKLTQNMSKEDKHTLILQEDRLDNHFDFFLRLNKKELAKGNYVLTQKGDCFHIRMNIATFPRNKEKAREIVKMIFS